MGEGRQYFRREVQSGRRRGHGSGPVRINRLVAHAVVRVVVASEVGRYRHAAVAFKVGFLVEPHDPCAVGLVDRLDVRPRSGDVEGGAGPGALPRTSERPPTRMPQLVEDEQFDAAVRGKQARRQDAGVVEHKEVARGQKLRQFAEHAVVDFTRGTIHDHHARRGAVGQRTRGDQLPRQIEIVVRNVRTHLPPLRPTRPSPAWLAATVSRSAARCFKRRARNQRNPAKPAHRRPSHHGMPLPANCW